MKVQELVDDLRDDPPSRFACYGEASWCAGTRTGAGSVPRRSPETRRDAAIGTATAATAWAGADDR